ncbi:bacterial transferase hexapeptide family protein [Synechococcus sp. BIOS-U3-1]|uniref:acetyltransferase n=1 Tax=Synechococcus sp. BIOS-U3-1 TaxID=1400865 RepID=UPI00164410A4|nr:acetyltransferase [Synechococcus sp. BIOS-U3-1]QNI57171.1 bacterial transferase hexapeptide family protein [Synechococcus sp. BIOS-U3-1]
MVERILIYGNGQMAEIVYTYLKADPRYEVVGFTCDSNYISEEAYFGLPLYEFETIEKKVPPESCKMLIVMSSREVNETRKSRYMTAKTKGYNFISYISPHALIFSTAKVGENCFILENNVIQHFAEIGNNVIMWSGNHFGHHSKLESHSFVTSHVVISGRCTIGESCFIGVNSTIRDGLHIGERAVIGAGANILRDIPSSSVVMGLPGRIISSDSSTANIF